MGDFNNSAWLKKWVYMVMFSIMTSSWPSDLQSMHLLVYLGCEWQVAGLSFTVAQLNIFEKLSWMEEQDL